MRKMARFVITAGMSCLLCWSAVLQPMSVYAEATKAAGGGAHEVADQAFVGVDSGQPTASSAATEQDQLAGVEEDFSASPVSSATEGSRSEVSGKGYGDAGSEVPDSGEMSLNLNVDAGKLDAAFSSSKGQPSNVAFAITDQSGMTKWYQAYKQSDDSWKAAVDLLAEFGRWGSYAVEAWGTFGTRTVKATASAIQLSNSFITSTASVEAGKAHVVTAGFSTNPHNVAYAVRAEDGHTNWYQAYRQADGSWSADIAIGADFGRKGVFTVTPWATFVGATQPLNATTLKYDASEVAVTAAVKNGEITVSSSNWGLDPSNVAFAVAGPSGVVRWYQAHRQSDGAWAGSIPAGVDFTSAGSFKVFVYATYAGKTSVFATTEVAVEASTAQLTARADYDHMNLAVGGWNLTPKNVAFTITNSVGITKWIQAVKQADGSWAASVSVRDAGGWGSYRVLAFVTFGAKTAQIGSSSTVMLTPGDVKASIDVSQSSVLTFKGSGWSKDPSNVAFEVRMPNGSVRWLQGLRQSDGSWAASGSATRDFKQWGTYSATVWATFGGYTSSLARSSTSVTMGDVAVTAKTSGIKISLEATGWKLDADNVAFEIRKRSGRSTWIQAHRDSNGNWNAQTSVAELREWYDYTITVWATYDGFTASIAKTTCSVNPGYIAMNVTISGGSFTIRASGWKMQPSNVAFEISGHWVQASKQSDGSWAATCNASDGFDKFATWQATTWATIEGYTSSMNLTHFDFPTYIGYQNPWPYYQVSNRSVTIKNLGADLTAYRTESRIPYNASRLTLINTMVTRAMEYLGTRYVWDYSAAPGVGVDCAGLVMQALYADGMDLAPFDPWDHYHTPGHDQYANGMWNSGRFLHVSFADRQVGDLICYPGHIAIYIGGNRIIEAWPGTGVHIRNGFGPLAIKGVLRPIV